MLAFVRAVECNGFSPAARDLGVTPSAVSKLVTRLERRLGVRLEGEAVGIGVGIESGHGVLL